MLFAFLHPGRYQVLGGIVSPVSDGYGKQGLVPAKHRIAMARLALQSSNWVTVDEWESQQADWTETAVTMRYYSATAHTLWRKVVVIQGGWMWDRSGLCSPCAAVQVCWLQVQHVRALHRLTPNLFGHAVKFRLRKFLQGKKKLSFGATRHSLNTFCVNLTVRLNSVFSAVLNCRSIWIILF